MKHNTGLLTKQLKSLGEIIKKNPLVFVLIFTMLTIISLYLSTTIGMNTRIKDLLPEDNPQSKAYTQVTDKFTTASLLLITIEGEHKDEIILAAEKLSRLIKQNKSLSPLIKSAKR